ncbi:MAG: helix-turn-helix domain-containing protein [Planctomycetes bacterium]|nr:helix-turn-helix domain-containing protein [Planctomycetota bacterium]
MAVELLISEVAPEIRGANYFDTESVALGPRWNYAYQLFYVFRGEGSAVICGTPYSLEPGFLTIYGPGQVHEFRNTGRSAMAVGTINFSWRREPPRRMAMGNRSLTSMPADFKNLSDPLYRIEGLPEFPFALVLPKDRRGGIEHRLRGCGTSFRKFSDPAMTLKYKAALLEILFDMVAYFRESSGEGRHHALDALRRFVYEKYERQLSRADAARASGISESHLTTLLRKELGTNFTDFLTRVRMEAAMELLQFSDLSVKEIAARCGFADYNYFVARFRSLYGSPPGKWRLR